MRCVFPTASVAVVFVWGEGQEREERVSAGTEQLGEDTPLHAGMPLYGRLPSQSHCGSLTAGVRAGSADASLNKGEQGNIHTCQQGSTCTYSDQLSIYYTLCVEIRDVVMCDV